MYDPGTADGWRALVAAGVASKGPRSPVRGAARLELWFYLPRPKSHYRASGALTAQAPEYPIVKPDWDNLGKALSDELTNCRVWDDDKQVVSTLVEKRYAERGRDPGVQIEVFCL